MHPVEMHQKAVAFANKHTQAKFCKPGPYDPGSPENEYWLTRYDLCVKMWLVGKHADHNSSTFNPA